MNDELLTMNFYQGALLIEEWLKKRTYHYADYGNIANLVKVKQERGLKVSVGLPTRNVAPTLGPILRVIKKELIQKFPLVDQLAVIDSRSQDETVVVAKNQEVPVFFEDEILTTAGVQKGKGEALWKSLSILDGDIICWIDSDIENFNPRFVYGLVGSLLLEEGLKFVKAYYRRPIHVEGRLEETGGGRVTELVTRPVFNIFYPQLAGFIQPLSGEYAGYREVLEQVPFYTGYAVETALLVDIQKQFGIDCMGQVDMSTRVHANQSTMALGRMSFAILQAVFEMLRLDGKITLNEDISNVLNVPSCPLAGKHGSDKKCELAAQKIEVVKREPIINVPEYQEIRRQTED